ncbi:MAG TPA: type I restriction endonuclease subunit M, partial [Rhodospirillales bacterium]|nr:type I restriction endonuclease subunit M [Rhodospirillales bacterium]
HDFPTANILKGDTLDSPKFKDGEQLRTYDFVVANPPFSDKAWSTGLTPGNDPFQRFEWGEPPAKQGDYAYLLHIIRSMKSTGKAACILPHGVLFRGNAEAVIRKRLVRSGYLKGIIGLPANLFYGTGIPACILVLDKENARARKGVFMIGASRGFIKDGNKNRLREQDIHKIVDTFTRQNGGDPSYGRMVPFDEIADAKNDYNLNLPRYIDSTEAEDIQDIDGHLRGGIPGRDVDALDAYWQVIPAVRDALFEGADRPGYVQLRLPTAEVKSAIFGHDEFTSFKTTVTGIFDQWCLKTAPGLKGFDREDQPRALIETIAEDLLDTFRAAPLLDAYDVYQHLMDFWAATMQDDCYLIAADGWLARPHRVVEEIKNGKKKGEKKDKGWACDLIPKPCIVARYFAGEQAELDALQAEQESALSAMAELEEEHGGEEGAFADLEKINKGEVNKRLKEIKGDPDYSDEARVLKQWAKLDRQQSALKRQTKEADAVLDRFAYEKYPQLSVDEIKTLVVDDKWLAALSTAVQGELDRVSQTLTGRIRQLAERYQTPLPQLTNDVVDLSARVDEHLKRMGATWN